MSNFQAKKVQRKEPFAEEKLPEVKSNLSRTARIGPRKEKIRLVWGWATQKAVSLCLNISQKQQKRELWSVRKVPDRCELIRKKKLLFSQNKMVVRLSLI